MKKLIFFFVASALVLSSCNSVPATSFNSGVDSASYAIGVNAGHMFYMNIQETPGDPINVDNVIAGFISALKNDTANLVISANEAIPVIQNYFREVEMKEAAIAKEEGAKYLAEKEKEEGVQKTESGLLYKVVTEGTGAKPKATDRVKVNYRGTLVDGTEFDSSYARNEPATFGVNQVIPGWTEGLQLMTVGSKYIFYIPSELAYGERPAGRLIKPNSVLTFEVELLDIEPAK